MALDRYFIHWEEMGGSSSEPRIFVSDSVKRKKEFTMCNVQ